MRRSFHCVVVASMVAACGGRIEDVSSGSNPATDAGTPPIADAGVLPGSDASAPDAPDTDDGPVRIIRVTPSDAAEHVAPLSKVVLLLSGRADPASIDESTVRLYAPNASQPLAATVVYDPNALTITLTPRIVLGTRQCASMGPPQSSDTYAVATSQLRALGGAPIADFTSRFTTLHRALTNEAMFTGGTALSPSSDPTYTKTTLAPDGRVASVMHYSAGPNHLQHDTDDAVTMHEEYTYADNGMQVSVYGQPGPDGLWLTTDDVMSSRWIRPEAPKDRFREIAYQGPGPDGVWITDDDVIGAIWEWDISPDGQRVVQLRMSLSAGVDGVPFTADDPLDSYRGATWSQTTGSAIEYYDKGPDGVWFTADDDINVVWDYTLDAWGRVATAAIKAKGNDGVWLTADDAITFFTECESDANGVDTGQRQHLGPGPDGVWHTPDDLWRLWVQYDHAPNGASPSYSVFDGPGPDGIWHTPDDHVGERVAFDTTL